MTATLEALLEAQRRARELFAIMDEERTVRPGRTEREIGKAIYALAEERLGVTSFWHKRIVRSGPNTLHPYAANPPDRRIEPGDIAFIDLGPVFAQWEADFGRTYVFGEDEAKRRIAADVERAWDAGVAYFRSHPEITCAELYAFMGQEAQRLGWEFGGPIAGHRIGEFPHEKILGDEIEHYIHPDNPRPMRQPDEGAEAAPLWILEAHLVDRGAQIGAFVEDLLLEQ